MEDILEKAKTGIISKKAGCFIVKCETLLLPDIGRVPFVRGI